MILGAVVAGPSAVVVALLVPCQAFRFVAVRVRTFRAGACSSVAVATVVEASWHHRRYRHVCG
jgi:hypothetical protein